ncbi:lipopolysaccharide-induced tumor necrosis factor-alpha factor homolog [Achroia grisella]|uniref:lipopolysaccharide-induced tumor necrosis factor-alpha factor homolog n=1 Tax=Achroia grisella TaxID=688607 RepID=UPI0027D3466D|nr:lipopolysaccharide-induced tumor necrosis factor-alpha factor homolog [Achroia grisella]
MDTSGKVGFVNNPQSLYPPINPPPYPGPEVGYGAPYPAPQGTAPMPPGPTVYHQVPQAVVTVTPGLVPGVVVGQHIGPQPTRVTCRSCNEQTTTRIEQKSSMRTHMMALLLCVFGLWPCVCIPYCMDSCMNVDHYCSNCGSYVGTYQN